MPSVDEALSIIQRGTDEILVESNLKKQLEENRPLRIKLGLDPTAPDIHLGHTVVINKMRQLQTLGHEAVFLVGDFTALIGDPSGKDKTRQPLTAEDIAINSKTYQDQVFKILDPEKTVVMRNSEWMGQQTAADMIRLASTQTVAQILERDNFQKRYQNGQPIALHEFLYPMVQGYDSVAMKADIELGGTEQKFNLLMGRELQKHFGQAPQTVITMPLLEGLDGVKKMSKSLGNYIGVDEPPHEIFGKVMSISDDLMWRYYELLSFQSEDAIAAMKQSVAEGANPKNIKVALAQELVARFHDETAAARALDDFQQRFSRNEMPDEVDEKQAFTSEDSLGISQLLKQAGLVSSTSEAMRMIRQGAVKIDGQRIDDTRLNIAVNETALYQVGKRRFARVTVVCD